jgi:hypothetical protein
MSMDYTGTSYYVMQVPLDDAVMHAIATVVELAEGRRAIDLTAP